MNHDNQSERIGYSIQNRVWSHARVNLSCCIRTHVTTRAWRRGEDRVAGRVEALVYHGAANRVRVCVLNKGKRIGS